MSTAFEIRFNGSLGDSGGGSEKAPQFLHRSFLSLVRRGLDLAQQLMGHVLTVQAQPIDIVPSARSGRRFGSVLMIQSALGTQPQLTSKTNPDADAPTYPSRNTIQCRCFAAARGTVDHGPPQWIRRRTGDPSVLGRRAGFDHCSAMQTPGQRSIASRMSTTPMYPFHDGPPTAPLTCSRSTPIAAARAAGPQFAPHALYAASMSRGSRSTSCGSGSPSDGSAGRRRAIRSRSSPVSGRTCGRIVIDRCACRRPRRPRPCRRGSIDWRAYSSASHRARRPRSGSAAGGHGG